MSTYCLGQNEVTIRTELEILKPLVGKTWVVKQTSKMVNWYRIVKGLEPMRWWSGRSWRMQRT